MDISTIDQVITAYINRNLSPAQSERKMISERYDQLQKILPGQTFQNGSYARHTSTTPVNDLDVFYILPESLRKQFQERQIDVSELSIDDILNDLATALGNEYKNEARIVVQPHSVGIFFGEKNEFSIDVVPAQPLSNGMYLVPETALHSVRYRRLLYEAKAALVWIKSDPKGYIEQAIALDGITDGNFRRTAKFIKKWRQACKRKNDNFSLKSFHLEIILTEFLKCYPLKNSIDSINRYFSMLPSLITETRYPDKADSTRYIDSYLSTLTSDQIKLSMDEIAQASEIMSKILIATSESIVLKAVEELFCIESSKTNTAIVTAASTARVSQAYSKPYYL